MSTKLTRAQYATIVVLVGGSFIAFLNQTLINPSLSTMMLEFNVDTATVQWLTNGFTMVNAVMVPIAAYFLDNFTTRRLFVISMSIFLAGSLLAAWGASFLILLGGRLLQAVGAGVIMPMVLTVLMVSFPMEQRGQAMGVYSLISCLAPSIGPTLAGIVIDQWNWHFLFVGISVLSVAGIVAGAIAMRKPQVVGKGGAELDKLSVVESSMGLGMVLYSFSAIGSSGFTIINMAILVVGCVIVALFVKRQLKLEKPMLNMRILKNRRFTISTILGVILQASVMCAPVLVPIYIQTIRGFSATISGLTLMPGALLMAALSPVAGRLFDKFGPRALAIGGSVALVAGSLPFVFFGMDTPLWLVTLGMATRQAAVAIMNTPVSTWGMNALDGKVMSHGTSINNTARMIAGALGTALVVSASSLVADAQVGMDYTQAQLVGFNVAFAISTALCVVGLVITVAKVKDTKTDAAQADTTGERRMTLESIMMRDVFTVRANATIAEAAKLFIDKNISAAPVVNERGIVVGFISDGDILRALSTRDNKEFVDPITLIIRSTSSDRAFGDKIDALMDLPVMSIAHKGVISVNVHDRMSVVCRVMGENHLKKVPVVDDGKIVGVINRSDITKYSLRRYIENRVAMQ